VVGSPFSCKVYDVTAIKVKDAKRGVIGMPVTFLGAFLLYNYIYELSCLHTEKTLLLKCLKI